MKPQYFCLHAALTAAGRTRWMLLGALALSGSASAAAAEPDPHAHHHAMAMAVAAQPPQTRIDVSAKSLPLVRADGAAADLAGDLAAETRPVLLNFVFTSCSAICPVMSRVFSQVQTALGADAAKVRMVSISIDPEHDTPERLTEYSARFGAGPQWSFYTGTAQGSIAAQRAFGAYRGDRMNHEARTFVRAARGKDWLRIDGLATPEALVAQVRATLTAP